MEFVIKKMVAPRLVSLKRVQQGVLGRGEKWHMFNPTDNGRRVRLQSGLSVLLGTDPRLEGPCELGGLCSLLLAVTRVFSQERESKIVGQGAGISGARSGKQGPSAAPEIQL